MGIIKRQGITNTIITYIGIAIGAVNIIFIQPKLLSEEELGLTRLLYDFAYLIGLAVPLGLPNIIIKYFPFFKDRQHRHHGFAGFILLVFFIGFIIAASLLLLFKPVILSYYTADSQLFVTYFSFVLPFTFIVSAITVTTTYCYSLFKSTVPSFLNDICVRLGSIVIIVLYYNQLINFTWFIYAFVGVYAIELFVLGGYILLVDRITFRFDKKLFKDHTIGSMMRFGLLLCVASFASIALRKADAIILGTISLKLVGVYTTAIFITSFIEVPLGALDRISSTRIADAFAKNDMPQIEKIYSDSVKYLLIIGGLLFVGINACTKYVYELGKLPQSYTDCINVVYIVALGALVNISTGVNSAIIFYSKYYGLGTLLLVITLVISVALNVLLIPVYGIYGAATACLAGTVIYNLVKYVFIYSKLHIQPYTIKSFFIFGLSLVCALLSHLMPDFWTNPFWNLIFKGGLFSLIYIAVIYYFKFAPELFKGLSLKNKATAK